MMLVDTSGLLAALSPAQRHHESAATALREAEPPLILSPFILAEIDYLLTKMAGTTAALRFLAEVERKAYELVPFDALDVRRAREVIEQYEDLAIGLADASLVVLAERYGLRDLLTLDQRHFRVLRPKGRKSFRLLPADL